MKRIYFSIIGVCISIFTFAQCFTNQVPLIASNSGNGDCYNDNLFVNGSIISSNSGFQSTGNSYQSFSSPFINLQIGNNYNFEIFGISNSNYNLCVWFDFNGNQIFEQSEQAIYINNSTNIYQSFYITIPADAIIDTIKVRLIILQDAGGWGSGADDACNIISNGEIEEYDAIIGCPNSGSVYFQDNQIFCYQNTVLLYASADFGDVSWYTDTNLAPVFTGNNFYLPISISTVDTIVFVQNTYGTCFNGSKYPMNMHILPLPQVIINSPDTVHSCTSYTFIASPGFLDYYWSTGQTGDTITISSGYGGSLSVNATFDNGCISSDQVLAYIAPDSPSTYAHAAKSSDFCNDHIFNLQYDSLVSPGTCSWYLLPSNTLVGTGSFVQYFVSSTGNYQFKACINSTCGLDTAFLNISYLLNPAYDSLSVMNGNGAGNSIHSVCYTGNSLQAYIAGFTGTVLRWYACDTINFSWFPFEIPNDTLAISSMYVTMGHVYAMFAEIIDQNGCIKNTDTLFVKPENTLSLNLPDNYTMCNFPGDYGIPAVDYGVYDLLWSTGDTTNNIYIDTEGLYTITTLDNITGCINYDQVIIHIGSANITLLPPVTYICSELMQLNFMNENAISWTEYDESWGFINSGNNIDYFVNYQGFNEYLVIEANVGGCSIIDTTYIDFIGSFSFNLGNDVSTTQSSYTINGPAGYSSYLWNPIGNTSSITVTNSGNYSLTIDNGFGCIFTDTIHVSFIPNNIQKENESTSISIYPNPASKNISFVSENPINEIKIVDLTGRIIINKECIGSNNFSLDISKLPEGYYFSEITTNQGKSVKKIIITK